MPNKRSASPAARAQELLKQLGLSSLPVPLDKVAKSLGAQIRCSPLDEELSGMVFIKAGVPIIGVNSLHHPNRQRFTVAHEIGHLVLHRELITNTVHVDKKFPVLMRDATSATGTQKIEIEANQFAAELLMPESLIYKTLGSGLFDIEDDGPLDEWARMFRVSRQALEYRIRNLI